MGSCFFSREPLKKLLSYIGSHLYKSVGKRLQMNYNKKLRDTQSFFRYPKNDCT